MTLSPVEPTCSLELTDDVSTAIQIFNSRDPERKQQAMPPIGPGQTLVNKQYVQLLTRTSCEKKDTLAVPPGTNNFVQSVATINVPKGQGIRVVSFASKLAEISLSRKVYVECLALHGLTPSPNYGLVFSVTFPGTHILFVAALELMYSADEIIMWNDYAELGGIASGIALEATLDVTNTDAVEHNVFIQSNVLVETYQLNTLTAPQDSPYLMAQATMGAGNLW